MTRATARLVKTHLRAAATVLAIASALFLAVGTTALAQQATLSQKTSVRVTTALSQQETPSQASSLSFSDAEEVLVVELDPNFFWIEHSPAQEQAETSVTIINGSEESLKGLDFGTQYVRDQDGNLQDEKHEAVVTVEPVEKDTTMNPRGSKTFNLRIGVQNPPEQLTGELFVKAKDAEGVEPGRRSFMISEPPAPLSNNASLFDEIVVDAGILAVAFIVPHFIWRVKRVFRRLSKPIDWDPKASWAATLTTVGGVGGVLLATQLLPKNTKLLSNNEFAALGVFFSVCIFFGAFFFNSIRRKETRIKDGKETPVQVGYVGIYLIAMLINMWGVFGQLAIVFLVLNELKVQGGMTNLATIFLLVLLAISALLTIVYASLRTADDLKQTITIRVTGTQGVPFSGSYGTPDGQRSVDGQTPQEYEVEVDTGLFSVESPVSATFQKKLQDQNELRVEIVRGGDVVAEQNTTPQSGEVSVNWSPQR